MQLTRLNVLVVLGVVTIAAGAAFGTGAFTTVEAERTVDVESQGDGGAMIQFAASDSELVSTTGGTGGDLLEISQANLNKNATTTAEAAITVTNDGAEDVGFYVDTGGANVLDFQNDSTSIEGTSGSVDLAAGASVDLTLVIDLTGETNTVDSVPDSVTFVADTNQFDGAA